MPVFDKKQAKKTVQSVINELVERTNSNTRRLRVLEQRGESLESRTNTLEKELLDHSKNLKKLIDEVSTRVTTEDDKILKVENTIKEIVTQMKRLATTADIRGLQGLIDIYNPLKSNFVTKEELERFIEEKIINK